MAVLDPRLLGPALTVVVAVDLASEGSEALAAFRARVLEEGAVAQCWYVTGRYDFILVVRVSDIAAYEALAQRLFEADPNVKKSESLVVLDEVKRDLAVPVRVRSTGS
jgi:DNA-binding Lrp family transcriptional regulator